MDAILAMMVFQNCHDIDGGLPSHLQARMLFNIALDFVIGLVPFLGDLADAVYKCNTRNAIILEKYLRERAGKMRKSRRKREHQREQVPEPVDLSIPEEFDRYESNILEHHSDHEQDISRSTQLEQRYEASSPNVSVPQPSTSRSRGPDWLGGVRSKPGDLETGVARK